VRIAEASFGFQAGGQAIDAVILIMNQAGIDMLLKTRFTIGVDASAAAGPVGRDVSAEVGPGTALLTYARSKGLFAGASFEGGAMFNHDGYNHALYGMPIGLREILLQRRVPLPREAMPLINTLRSYAVRNTANSGPRMPGNAGGPRGTLAPAGNWAESGREVRNW
jgi:lipid-binding SYLF domain-containing protein